MRHAIAIGLFTLLAACPVRAEAPPPDPSAGESYDGRAHPPGWRAEVTLVPRLALTPLRLTFRGLGWCVHHVLDWDERNHVYATVLAALSSRDGLIGVRPAFQYSVSYTPVVGARLFDRKLLGHGTNFELTAMAGGVDVVYAQVAGRPTPSVRALELGLRAVYNRRNDQLFHGIGPVTDSRRIQPASRYAIDAVDTGGALTLKALPGLSLGLDAGFGLQRFGNGRQIGSDLPIAEVYCLRALGRCVPGVVDPVRVPGFDRGTQFVRVGGMARLDSRDNWYRPSSGGLVELGLHYTHGVGFDRSQYLRGSGALSGVLDLWQRSRVLVVRVAAELLEPIGSAPVPFTELVTLGGPDSFRGFRAGRFRDFSSLLFAAEYRWPIWMWMDASLFAEYGGVFGRRFTGFSIERMRPDVGAGVRLRSSDAFYVRAQAAYGWGEGWQFFLSLNTGL
jgi:outer membrane protein assembly factor BamA